jgi:hypothetical protein
MPVVERESADVADDAATAAAVAEIRAAMSGVVLTDSRTTPMSTPDPPAAAASASASAAGHGTIRLRGRLPRPSEGPSTTAAGPDRAVAAGPVGHGVIRLRGALPGRSEGPRAVAAAGPVGHGIIRLRVPAPAFVSGGPVQPADAVTAAAREDIVAALAASA